MKFLICYSYSIYQLDHIMLSDSMFGFLNSNFDRVVVIYSNDFQDKCHFLLTLLLALL